MEIAEAFLQWEWPRDVIADLVDNDDVMAELAQKHKRVEVKGSEARLGGAGVNEEFTVASEDAEG